MHTFVRPFNAVAKPNNADRSLTTFDNYLTRFLQFVQIVSNSVNALIT